MFSWMFLLLILLGYLEVLPLLEAFSAQETYDAGIPSFLGNVGGFQCECDMTLPLLECCLLVIWRPVKHGWLEYELSRRHCAGIRLNAMVLKGNRQKWMVLKEKCNMAEFWYNLLDNGLERKWSWKKLPCTKLSITLAIMVGFGWNFDTIWVPIRVTSGTSLNCCCLPALSWIMCVFNTLPDLLIGVHNGHNRQI